MKWYETDDFLALRKEWYEKLAKDGFDDLEVIDWKTGDNRKRIIPKEYRIWGQYSYDKERYFQLAEQFMWYMRRARRKFTRREKVVWRHHARGFSYTEIAHKTGVPRGSIHAIVSKLRALMFEQERKESDEAAGDT